MELMGIKIMQKFNIVPHLPYKIILEKDFYYKNEAKIDFKNNLIEIM